MSNNSADVEWGINEFGFISTSITYIAAKTQPAEGQDLQQATVWDYRYEIDMDIHGYIFDVTGDVVGTMAEEISKLAASSLLTATAAVIVAISANAF